MRKFLSFIILVILLEPVYGLMELNGQYGYDRQVFGDRRQNKTTTETMSGALAIYLFELTGIEFNYSQSETITNQNTDVDIDSTYRVTGQRDTIVVYSYGVGIRQLLGNRKARFLPSVSFGYARQFQKDQTTYTFLNKGTSGSFDLSENPTKVRYDSVFGTLALNLRLTKMFSLRFSVKTIFKAFKFNQAQDNMKYLVGFTWYL